MISLSGYFDYKEDIKTILVIAEHDNTCDLLLKLCTIKHTYLQPLFETIKIHCSIQISWKGLENNRSLW